MKILGVFLIFVGIVCIGFVATGFVAWTIPVDDGAGPAVAPAADTTGALVAIAIAVPIDRKRIAVRPRSRGDPSFWRLRGLITDLSRMAVLPDRCCSRPGCAAVGNYRQELATSG